MISLYILLYIAVFVMIFCGLALTAVLMRIKDRFEGRADCAVIFGAAVKRGFTPSRALSDRILEGVDLYRKGRVSRLVLSGGPSRGGAAHEVDVMRKVAVENGVPESALHLDRHGLNTASTLGNLPDKRKRFVMVSNDFHLARIALFAARCDLAEFHLHAAPYREGRYDARPYYIFREVVALLFYALFRRSCRKVHAESR